jgi:predicted permease
MLATFLIVLPIFALILAGFLARRFGLLGPQATTEFNRFVVYLALPALLFDITAHARLADVWRPGFIAAFGLAALLVFALTVALRLRGGKHLADAAIDGLNAGYSNTGYMGFPLVLAAFGRDALPTALIATIITVCVIFAFAIILIEAGLQSESSRTKLVLKVATSLVRNPLLVAPVLGALVPLAGWSLPVPAENFLKMLGSTASPCALVALGLFLAAQSGGAEKRETWVVAGLASLKLLANPLLAWLLARFLFQLEPTLVHAAVLLSALPTGTGSFMLAEFYNREAEVTAKVVLISTIVSVATITGYLALIR